jgi:hypothetical protein
MSEPVLPLGTMVKARISGWDEAQEDDYVASHEQSLDVVPTFDGVPEWVEGELEGFDVQVTSSIGYFKHIVDGYDVDPDTVEKLETASIVAAATPVSQTDTQRLLDIDRDLRTKLHVAFNDHMARALEKTGAKIRSRMSKTASGRQWLSAHPCSNGVLARVTPSALLAAGGLEESMIVQQSWDDLRPIWFDFVASSDTALLRQIGKMAGIDYNALSAQEVALREASEEGWEFVQARMGKLALGYLSDSATVVAVDEITTQNLVDMGDVRQAMAIAGGSGQQDPTSAGLLVGDDMSIGVQPQLSTGPVATKTLGDNGYEVDSYTWVHGFTPSPFDPHVALDGYVFTEWSDPHLANNDTWPPNDFFAPGDHQGCQCDFYINWATPTGVSNKEGTA